MECTLERTMECTMHYARHQLAHASGEAAHILEVLQQQHLHKRMRSQPARLQLQPGMRAVTAWAHRATACSSTCIAGSAKKPTAARSEQGTVVMYQRGAAYKQSMQWGRPALTSIKTGGTTPAAMPHRISLRGGEPFRKLGLK